MNILLKWGGGYKHSLLLTNLGNVYSTGLNSSGQLGLGDTTNRNVFTKVKDISNVKDIACGYDFSFILKNDGTVYSCGSNSNGKLGLGNYNNNKTTFTKVSSVSNIKQLAPGYDHTLLLGNDGYLYGTGNNNVGQFGNNTTSSASSFTKISTISNVNKVVCGEKYSIALTSNNKVYSTGYSNHGSLGLGSNFPNQTYTTEFDILINGIFGVNIYAGVNHTFIYRNLNRSNKLYACGYNINGELGINYLASSVGEALEIYECKNSSNSTIGSGLSDCISGYSYSIILLNGSIYYAGWGTKGEIPSNSIKFTSMNESADKIAGGYYHIFKIKNNTGYARGLNDYGQLGIGSNSNTNSFTSIKLVEETVVTPDPDPEPEPVYEKVEPTVYNTTHLTYKDYNIDYQRFL